VIDTRRTVFSSVPGLLDDQCLTEGNASPIRRIARVMVDKCTTNAISADCHFSESQADLDPLPAMIESWRSVTL
jgi:hypothetical protein